MGNICAFLTIIWMLYCIDNNLKASHEKTQMHLDDIDEKIEKISDVLGVYLMEDSRK